MARSASPWFWERRHCWAVIIDGQRHVLGDHPDDTPPKKRKGKWVVPASIQLRYHELKAKPDAPPRPVASPAVVTIFDQFLEWCRAHRTPRTYEWSRNHIQCFINSLSDKRLTVADLKPFHVQQWADSHRAAAPGKRPWGPNHTRGAIIAVQRAFTWAEKMGHVLKSPIRNIEKPAPKRREQSLTRPEFNTLLSNVKDSAFRDVLEFCWETGARVQEVRLIRADCYKPDRGRVEIPPPEAKGKKRWRVIYLTDRAEEIVKRLVPLHADGPIFRNVDGKPWDAQNFNCRFVRLEKKLGVKYALTSLRHSFATRLLESGVDHVTVAALMGHVDATMLARVYSHVGERTDFLREELLKGSSAGVAV